jgi:hypothetical protein
MQIAADFGRLEHFARRFTEQHRDEVVHVESLGGAPSRAICFPTPARHLTLFAIQVVGRGADLRCSVILLDERRRKRRMDFGHPELVRVTDSALRVAGSGGEAVFRFPHALDEAKKLPRRGVPPRPLRVISNLPTGRA